MLHCAVTAPELVLKNYGGRYLSGPNNRFNSRFCQKGLLPRLLIACIECRPQPEHLLRSAELCC